jgi:hypothetical protein
MTSPATSLLPVIITDQTAKKYAFPPNQGMGKGEKYFHGTGKKSLTMLTVPFIIKINGTCK